MVSFESSFVWETFQLGSKFILTEISKFSVTFEGFLRNFWARPQILSLGRIQWLWEPIELSGQWKENWSQPKTNHIFIINWYILLIVWSLGSKMRGFFIFRGPIFISQNEKNSRILSEHIENRPNSFQSIRFFIFLTVQTFSEKS